MSVESSRQRRAGFPARMADRNVRPPVLFLYGSFCRQFQHRQNAGGAVIFPEFLRSRFFEAPSWMVGRHERPRSSADARGRAFPTTSSGCTCPAPPVRGRARPRIPTHPWDIRSIRIHLDVLPVKVQDRLLSAGEKLEVLHFAKPSFRMTVFFWKDFSMLNIVLVMPEMPPNTGNIGRLSLATGIIPDHTGLNRIKIDFSASSENIRVRPSII